jgi:hypothetical protein
MTKQTYKLTKKIAKHGNQAIIIVPTTLQEYLKPGMIVELEEDVRGKWIVRPAQNLNFFTTEQVQDTINKLGQNSRIVVVRRNKYVKDFINNIHVYSDAEMCARQPFVFSELRRLGRI